MSETRDELLLWATLHLLQPRSEVWKDEKPSPISSQTWELSLSYMERQEKTTAAETAPGGGMQVQDSWLLLRLKCMKSRNKPHFFFSLSHFHYYPPIIFKLKKKKKEEKEGTPEKTCKNRGTKVGWESWRLYITMVELCRISRIMKDE